MCAVLGVLRPPAAIFPPTEIHVWLRGQGKCPCIFTQLQLRKYCSLPDEFAGTCSATGKLCSLWLMCFPPSYWNQPCAGSWGEGLVFSVGWVHMNPHEVAPGAPSAVEVLLAMCSADPFSQGMHGGRLQCFWSTFRQAFCSCRAFPVYCS